VKNGAGSYGDIPYFDDARVDTHQESGADTVVRFKDSSGTTHQFATVDEYMSFYKASGREL